MTRKLGKKELRGCELKWGEKIRRTRSYRGRRSVLQCADGIWEEGSGAVLDEEGKSGLGFLIYQTTQQEGTAYE